MNIRPKIYYVFSGRFPSEKAHALYISKVADAFTEAGHNVTLVVSRRMTTAEDPQHFFDTKNPLRVVYMPTLDLYDSFFPKRAAYIVNYACFSIGCFFYFLFRRSSDDLIFSNESFPSLFLSLTGKRVVYEMHDYPEHYHAFFKLLYLRVFRILSQNQWKKEKLISEFAVDSQKILVEPNGVEIEKFNIPVSKEEARIKVGLLSGSFLAVYTGHLFDWKGADTLASAAKLLPANFQVVFVGGSPADVAAFRKKYTDVTTIITVGHRPHAEIPLWQKAADCLILPNTAKKNISKYYTSPMKLFEYMASGRPIIASDLPSIRAIASETELTFVTPDDPQALASTIEQIQQNYTKALEKTTAAGAFVQEHTWLKRAERLISLC